MIYGIKSIIQKSSENEDASMEVSFIIFHSHSQSPLCVFLPEFVFILTNSYEHKRKEWRRT